MSMNSIADIDDYDKFNFHYVNIYEQTRPLKLTTQNNVYSLLINEKGNRQYVYDSKNGKPMASPRSLLMLSVNNIVTQSDRILKKLNERTVSANIFNLVFKEAIFCGEFSLISHLISIWPSSHLKLSNLISNEIIDSDSLSRPMFQSGPTVLDYVLLGLLISRPYSRLRTIDFTGFHRDLKLTKEIVHLPLLWIKPEERTYEKIYEKIKSRCYIDKGALERYLENFNDIYQEYDRFIQHEVNYEQRSLIIDCHINCEDVTIGLALQYSTPFRFDVRKVWCSYGLHESEYSFKNYDIVSFINPNVLTHICLKDLFMIETPSDISILCSVLEKLSNLVAISLVRVLNFYPVNYTNEEITHLCSRFNKSLKRCYKLKKIDFSFNYLRSRLNLLLRGLVQPLEYLNLQDCRLDSEDISFLNTPPILKSLKSCKELNLSMNDFSNTYTTIFNIISNCDRLNCLSISHCQIPLETICQSLVNKYLLADMKKFSKLKYVMIQPFTPPKMHEIIDVLHTFSLLPSLQKLSFLPSLYAFPGNNENDREHNAIKVIRVCAGILESRGRSDIDFVDF